LLFDEYSKDKQEQFVRDFIYKELEEDILFLAQFSPVMCLSDTELYSSLYQIDNTSSLKSDHEKSLFAADLHRSYKRFKEVLPSAKTYTLLQLKLQKGLIELLEEQEPITSSDFLRMLQTEESVEPFTSIRRSIDSLSKELKVDAYVESKVDAFTIEAVPKLLSIGYRELKAKKLRNTLSQLKKTALKVVSEIAMTDSTYEEYYSGGCMRIMMNEFMSPSIIDTDEFD